MMWNLTFRSRKAADNIWIGKINTWQTFLDISFDSHSTHGTFRYMNVWVNNKLDKATTSFCPPHQPNKRDNRVHLILYYFSVLILSGFYNNKTSCPRQQSSSVPFGCVFVFHQSRINVNLRVASSISRPYHRTIVLFSFASCY